MTEQNILDIKGALDEAQDSTVPFAVVKDQNIAVFGDANKTAIKKRNYTIQFKIPVETDHGVEVAYREKTYRDVFITPRQEMSAVKMIAQLYPYFKRPTQDGEVEELTDEELLSIVASMEDKVIDTMYDFVAMVLGVDDALKEYMMGGSVISTAVDLIKSNPSTINEADAFFG